MLHSLFEPSLNIPGHSNLSICLEFQSLYKKALLSCTKQDNHLSLFLDSAFNLYDTNQFMLWCILLMTL